MIKQLFVDKSSGTYADILEAFGLAHVAIEIMERQDVSAPDAVISDKGHYYLIECDPGIEKHNLEMLRTNYIFPVKPIPTNQYNESKQPDGVPLVDWEAVQLFLKADTKEGVPKPLDLDILLTLNPEAIQGYDGLLFRLWNARRVQPEIFNILLTLYSDYPNNVDVALSQWEEISEEKADLISTDKDWTITPMITGQQLYNPLQGMAHNAVKMSDTLNWQSKPKINFWLIEWLRTIGFYVLSLPQLVGERNKRGEDKDRKILVLQPRKLSFSMNSIVLNEFKNTMLPDTAIRFDMFAVIRYLKALLVYYVDLVKEDEDFDLEPVGKIKESTVSGFHVAFYKKMGRGRSLMNLSFIGFPGWIEVHSENDMREYLDVLSELEQIVRQFDESHSEDVTLLQHLRDFISGDDLDAFFRFTNAFPAFLIGKHERNQYARPLTTEFIERLIMSVEQSLSPILASPGFQNIAYAIRQATVTAQYRKKQKDTKYEVRYGLGQELARKARYPQDFVVALSDFIHKFNAENARVMETRPGPYRRSIQTSDIDEVVRLIDEYGSTTVANLLIAYGHARVPREENLNEENEQE